MNEYRDFRGSSAAARRALMGPAVKRRSMNYLFSTCLIPATAPANDYPLFVVGIGGTGQGFGATALTSKETNLETGQRVPDQRRFIAVGLGCYISNAASEADHLQVAEAGSFRLDKPEFKQEYGMPVAWPAGFGSYSATAALATNGYPSMTARNILKPEPIILDPGETFKFVLNIPVALTNVAAVRFSIWLWGRSTAEIVQ